MTDQQIEQEIQAKGLTAPRITLDDIEANIAAEWYFTAWEGAQFAFWRDLAMAEPQMSMSNAPEDAPDGSLDAFAEGEPDKDGPLSLLTFCVLVLKNGFTVTGESACASPKNFDAEIGRKIARANAVNKVWPLMGYELRSKLAG